MRIPSGHRIRSYLGRARLPLTLILLLAPAMARANLGRPQSGGQLVAEPIGIEEVAIAREFLTIDLRPLAWNGLGYVEVVYNLHNHGTAKKLDLLFASGSAGVVDFRVLLDDQPIRSSPRAGAPLPASWQPPPQTPGLRDEKALAYAPGDSRDVTAVALTVVVPSGLHTLKVRYAAEAAIHHYGAPTLYHQFAYVLAPARTWAAFGGLDVTIHLPGGWRVACTPQLIREGATLTGAFADLPSDAIALTMQAPEGWAYPVVAYGSLGLLGAVGIGGAILCWRVGRSNRPSRNHGILRFGCRLIRSSSLFFWGKLNRAIR